MRRTRGGALPQSAAFSISESLRRTFMGLQNQNASIVNAVELGNNGV
jgi:hypothetical protein